MGVVCKLSDPFEGFFFIQEFRVIWSSRCACRRILIKWIPYCVLQSKENTSFLSYERTKQTSSMRKQFFRLKSSETALVLIECIKSRLQNNFCLEFNAFHFPAIPQLFFIATYIFNGLTETKEKKLRRI